MADHASDPVDSLNLNISQMPTRCDDTAGEPISSVLTLTTAVKHLECTNNFNKIIQLYLDDP
jgi:hypothetical protein